MATSALREKNLEENLLPVMPAQHHETPTLENLTQESSDDFYIQLIKDVFMEDSYKLVGK